jgi:DNA-binding IclR family transcriptional regulator
MSPRPRIYSREALLTLLRNRADKRGVIHLSQGDLATEVGSSKATICLILAEFEREGVLKQVSRGTHGRMLYQLSSA